MPSPYGNERTVSKLVSELEDAEKLSSRGRAYGRVCYLSHSDKRVVSWKFNEWDYGKKNITLPCNARGLFISDDVNNPVIVARGYDKFFNIGEVNFTKWEWIEENCTGPYDVTVKANGCIIFISGLKDGTLVVCSKHSTGPREDVDRNHAEAGEKHLLKQLADKNVNPNDFARMLYDYNITAVAEYCDDSFEEHILEYPLEKAGLYLHGVNVNESEFETWDIKDVSELARTYGFKRIESFPMNSLEDLRKLLDHCSTKGSFQGQEIEGFVIRCHLKNNGKPFFFKYKFEEPYLMYRQWREVTKDYICNKSRVFRFRKHKFITNKYLDFVIPILESSPKMCEDYMRGFGVIELRNKFLESYGMSGLEILNHEKVAELELKNAINYDKVDEHTKFLIFPISVIGCGKTTTSQTLINLFPKTWGHIQNDDITGKDKSQLMKKSLELLAKEEMKCVIVDRNNHQFRERKQLFEWIDELKEDYLAYDTNVKVIGASFAPSDKLSEIKDITMQRVINRGNNHQSIKFDELGEKKVVGIMSGFLKRYQPINLDRSPDNMFDLMIELDFGEQDSSLANAKQILNEIHKAYPILIPDVPTDNEIDKAFKKSLEYKPTVRKIIGRGNGNQPKTPKLIKPTYISANIQNSEEIIDLVRQAVTDNTELLQKFEELLANGKFQKDLHITLGHVMSSREKEGKKLWKLYCERYNDQITEYNNNKYTEKNENLCNNQTKLIKTTDELKFSLKKLCWDEKIIAVVVTLPGGEEGCLIDVNGDTVKGLVCQNEVPHITLCKLNSSVKAVYSNVLCQKAESTEVNDKNVKVFKLNKTKEFCASVYLNF
ncbi:trl1p [Saccharomyces arboricola H-6]|uniref:tRNA ligase n=1 Tax=Saccharomyces arboricola (strain H-6 / AS 2.3317 / CBS 10644) TaxID=1160507 RepID=J8PM27_SACAR|nr:trl1p [Saccharomyces arboricola H-6]